MTSLQPVPRQRFHDLARLMQPYEEAMIRDLASLCLIPSVKGEPTAQAPYGESTRLALVHFLELGENLGFRAVNLDNRAGYVEWGEGERLLAVICHLDVVPAGEGWPQSPWQVRVTDDQIIARGVSDDKGPAIAALYAIKALADSGWQPAARIRLIVGLDEESGMTCMEYYCQKAELPSAGFTADADFPVIYAEKGVLWLRLAMAPELPAPCALQLLSGQAGQRPNMVPDCCRLLFSRDKGDETEKIYQGIAAHASTPEKGKNAIDLAMADAAKMFGLAGSSHPFVSFYQAVLAGQCDGRKLGIACQDASGPLTVNAGLLEIQPQQASVTLDIRYPVSCNQASLLQVIRETVRPFAVEATVLEHMKPLHIDKDARLVRVLSQVYQEMTGTSQGPIAIGGGTYARTMPNIVAFGPAFPGETGTAHQVNESINRRSFLAAAAIYREALRRLSQP